MATAWRAIREAPEELYCKSNQKSQHNEIAARISTFRDESPVSFHLELAPLYLFLLLHSLQHRFSAFRAGWLSYDLVDNFPYTIGLCFIIF